MNNTRLSTTSKDFDWYGSGDEEYYRGPRVYPTHASQEARPASTEELLARSRNPTAQVQAVMQQFTDKMKQVRVTGPREAFPLRSSGNDGRAAARHELSPGLREAQREGQSLNEFKALTSGFDWASLISEKSDEKEPSTELDSLKLTVNSLENENEKLRLEMVRLKGITREAVDSMREAVEGLANAGKSKGLGPAAVSKGTAVLFALLDLVEKKMAPEPQQEV